MRLRNYCNSFFNFFEFDGVPSTNFGVMIFGDGSYEDPEPNESEERIPGRNGVLHFWDGTFKDIKVTYSVMAKGEDALEVHEKIENFRAWLLAKRKYCRLQDTFHPDYFRMGIYSGKTKIKYSENERMGGCEIKFNCKPQKFLRDGDVPITVTANTVLSNFTPYTAKPLLHFYGTAGVSAAFNIQTIKSRQINFQIPTGGQLILDVEDGEAYLPDGTNANNLIVYASSNTDMKLPELVEGNNNVLLSNLSKVEITPRWWTV